ncbi:MAG: hypothetical protein PHS34_07600 [Candidatus Omnitrophica bacterium]|nr:hypothetical protein [Candidatus Omnitrophota bacterium]MDD5551106.1 hypothetical protein [Candidatus Omnitrophota bacterium]
MKSEKIKELKKEVKPIRANGQMIKAVFDECIKQLSEGKEPVISKIMKEMGYSDYMAKTCRAVHTATWEELKNGLPKNEIFQVFTDLISRENDDKRTRLKAAEDLVDIYDLKPAQRIRYEEINEATEKFFKK